MSLNDILFSEEFLFEGERADAYRDRKEKERQDKYDRTEDRLYTRALAGNTDTDKGFDRHMRADEKASDAVATRSYLGRYKTQQDKEIAFSDAREAIDRHERRQERKNK